MTRLLCLLLILAAAPAGAADPAEAFTDARSRMAEAETALAAARAAGDRAAALGLAIGVYEDALADLRAAVVAAGVREREIALDLALRRDATTRLLASLQSLGRAPPGASGRLHPDGPLAAARAEAMLAHLRPGLEAEAAALAETLGARDAAREIQKAGFAALSRGLDALAAARAELQATLVAGAAPAGTPPSGAAAAAAARSAGSLAELAAALSGPGRAATRPGRLAWPVRGTLLRGFEAPDGAGVRQPALVLDAPPLSVVRAPAAAEVRYAGPFLDYGQVLVLRIDGGATVLLAGLARTTAHAGQRVGRGDPVGLLGGRTLDPEEYVMLTEGGAGAGAGQALHILIADERGPVDPEPWFGTENG